MKKNNYYISLITLCVLCSLSSGQQVEIDSNGDDRSFLINLPSDTNDPVPLVFILHGLGETGALWYGVASYIASQGIVTVRPESGTFLNNSGTGYVKLWNAILDSTRYDDVQFISDIIDYMLMNFEFIDYNKIYVLGSSNGGFMAYRLACDLSYRIAAFSSIAGNMFLDNEFDCTDQSRDIPIFHVHGTEDPINSYYPGGNGVDIIDDQYLTIVESIEFWSNYHQYDISEVDTILSNVSVRYTYTNDAVTSSFEHIKVIDGGHEYFYGEDFGFSSTQESIDYFLQFELSDFIINQEDTNGDGLYNTDDISIVVDYIFEQSQNSTSFDFNLDQSVDLFDVLILSDTIF